MNQKHLEASTKRKQRAAARKRKTWLLYGLFGLGGLALIAMVVLLIGQSSAQAVIPPRIGAPLSDFALTDLLGQKVRLSDYEGQVVLVNSWATWCPPCKAEMPDLNAYYQAHQNEGFVILAINAGDPADSATAFAQSRDLAFPVLLDPDLAILNGFGIHSFPTSIVVGRDGRVNNIHVGMYSPEQLEADINPLLSSN